MSNDRQKQITSCEGAWTVKDADLYGSEMVEDFASACKWEFSSSFYVEGNNAVHGLALRNSPSVKEEESSPAYVEGAKAAPKLALRKLPSVIAAASSFLIDPFAAERFHFWQSLKAA